jgi:hypothetical protein
MSVILKDTQGKSVQVNAWNWGVLHFAVECAKPPVFEDNDFLDRLRFGGVTLTKAQADSLFVYLAETVLPRLQPGQRMLTDFSVTDEPDDGTMHHDDLEKNYSLHYEVLVSVLDFLADAQAPITIG